MLQVDSARRILGGGGTWWTVLAAVSPHHGNAGVIGKCYGGRGETLASMSARRGQLARVEIDMEIWGARDAQSDIEC